MCVRVRLHDKGVQWSRILFHWLCFFGADYRYIGDFRLAKHVCFMRSTHLSNRFEFIGMVFVGECLDLFHCRFSFLNMYKSVKMTIESYA